jgi:hypothetical protein
VTTTIRVENPDDQQTAIDTQTADVRGELDALTRQLNDMNCTISHRSSQNISSMQ